jgi:hypothetical protein
MDHIFSHLQLIAVLLTVTEPLIKNKIRIAKINHEYQIAMSLQQEYGSIHYDEIIVELI